jgi:hypothetical protein
MRRDTEREEHMAVLTAAQKQHFDGEGYVVVEDVLDPGRDIAPLMT